jgi:hypothetical protein
MALLKNERSVPISIETEEAIKLEPEQSHGMQAYRALRFAYVIIPIIAGFDKFFDFTTNWDDYVSPAITDPLGISAHGFMMTAGVIEIVAGIGVALFPRVFGYVVSAWLVGAVANLLILGNYYDIALRDLGLAVGAFALGKLSQHFAPVPRRRLQALQ